MSNYGKYENLRGSTVTRSILPATPSKGIVGKGLGKSCNYPMDSEAEFDKRLKRYNRQKAAAEAQAAEDAASKAAVEAGTEAEAVPA